MSDLNLSSVSGKAVQAATFARGAYDTKTPFVPPAGFEPLKVVLEYPQSPDFAASAYVNPKTGELVVAYRGSDSTTDLTTALKAAANASVQTSTTVSVGDARLKSAATVMTTPAQKISRYEREHRRNCGVFRRNLNIWVYTTAVACKNSFCVTTTHTF